MGKLLGNELCKKTTDCSQPSPRNDKLVRNPLVPQPAVNSSTPLNSTDGTRSRGTSPVAGTHWVGQKSLFTPSQCFGQGSIGKDTSCRSSTSSGSRAVDPVSVALLRLTRSPTFKYSSGDKLDSCVKNIPFSKQSKISNAARE